MRGRASGAERARVRLPGNTAGRRQALLPFLVVQFTNSLVSLYPRTGTPSFPDTPITPVTLDSFIGPDA